MGRMVENGAYAPHQEFVQTDDGFSESKLRKRTETAQSQTDPQLDELILLSQTLTSLLEHYRSLLVTDLHQAARVREEIARTKARLEELFQTIGT